MREPNVDLLSVLHRYGYAIPAHYFGTHAGEACQIDEMRGSTSVANAGYRPQPCFKRHRQP